MSKQVALTVVQTCEACQDADAIPTLSICQPCLLTRMTEVAATHAAKASGKCEWCAAPTRGQLLCKGCTRMRVWESRGTMPRRSAGWSFVVNADPADAEVAPGREGIPVLATRRIAPRVDSGAICARPSCGHFLTLHERDGLCYHENGSKEFDCDCTKPMVKGVA